LQRLQQKPYYTRIALLGIAMYLFIEAVILIVTLIFEPSEWAYACIVGGIAGAVGAIIYFVRPWGLIVGIFFGLVGILFADDGLGDGLSSPDSFLDFAYRPVFGLAAAVFVLGGSLAGLVQHVRGRTSTSGPANVTRAVKGVVGLVAILSVFSAVLTVANVHGVSRPTSKGLRRLQPTSRSTTPTLWRQPPTARRSSSSRTMTRSSTPSPSMLSTSI
jgi:hypothetical protein